MLNFYQFIDTDSSEIVEVNYPEVDIQNLKYDNDCFDVLITDQVLEHIEDPRYGSLLASLILFFVPTIVLGKISPYAVRLLVEHRDESGHVAGKLYFVSTIGSALGTLLTSFYLVLYFEVNQILMAIFAALILCGLVAVSAGREEQPA